MAAIADAAERHDMVAQIPRLVRQCRKESAFDEHAHNEKSDCYGLFQLQQATAAELGVDRRDWRQNIEGGVRYMARLLRQYKGDYERALVAYNWGMGRLAKLEETAGAAWRQYLPAETRDYVKVIMEGAHA